MRQIDLLSLAANLPPGKAINIQPQEIREAAGGDLSYYDGPPRREDVTWFVEKVNKNWGVELRENMESGFFTMFKPTEVEKGRSGTLP